MICCIFTCLKVFYNLLCEFFHPSVVQKCINFHIFEISWFSLCCLYLASLHIDHERKIFCMISVLFNLLRLVSWSSTSSNPGECPNCTWEVFIFCWLLDGVLFMSVLGFRWFGFFCTQNWRCLKHWIWKSGIHRKALSLAYKFDSLQNVQSIQCQKNLEGTSKECMQIGMRWGPKTFYGTLSHWEFRAVKRN